METILGDTERAEAIYELAINQSKLDMPEVLWKAYIDFQIEQEEYDKTRKLYRRLLERTQHVKVGTSGQLQDLIMIKLLVQKYQTCKFVYFLPVDVKLLLFVSLLKMWSHWF